MVGSGKRQLEGIGMNTRTENFMLWLLNIPFVLLVILVADEIFYIYILLNHLFFGTTFPPFWLAVGMFIMSAGTGIQFVVVTMRDSLKTRLKKIHKLDAAFLNN
jgi:hypothetical protein